MQKKHTVLLSVLCLSLLIAGSTYISIQLSTAEAAPPTSRYEPGETLSPDCPPGNANCSVVPPARSGVNNDITDLTGITETITLPERLGIGTDPGEKLHVANGNILLSSALEQEMRFFWDTTFPDPFNPGVAPDRSGPLFKLGRVILGGVDSPVFRFMYEDSQTPEKSVFEIEDTGTVASVRSPGSPGSHFEGFFAGEVEPIFRLNSFPSMQLELGEGGNTPTDVILRRMIDSATTNQPALSILTNGGEKVRITNNGLGVNTTSIDASFVSGGGIALHGNNELIQNIPNGGLTIDVGDRSFLRLKSDCAIAANCTFTLNPGTFGQLLTLQWDDNADTGLLLDANFMKLSADWQPDEFDTLTLIDTYDEDTGSHYWVETSRSAN